MQSDPLPNAVEPSDPCYAYSNTDDGYCARRSQQTRPREPPQQRALDASYGHIEDEGRCSIEMGESQLTGEMPQQSEWRHSSQGPGNGNEFRLQPYRPYAHSVDRQDGARGQ